MSKNDVISGAHRIAAGLLQDRSRVAAGSQQECDRIVVRLRQDRCWISMIKDQKSITTVTQLWFTLYLNSSDVLMII